MTTQGGSVVVILVRVSVAGVASWQRSRGGRLPAAGPGNGSAPGSRRRVPVRLPGRRAGDVVTLTLQRDVVRRCRGVRLQMASTSNTHGIRCAHRWTFDSTTTLWSACASVKFVRQALTEHLLMAGGSGENFVLPPRGGAAAAAAGCLAAEAAPGACPFPHPLSVAAHWQRWQMTL
jgi:hypothetical protein